MKKSQAMIEKVLIIVAIAAAILVMQVWFRWSLAGRMKAVSDSTLGDERFDTHGNFTEASTQAGDVGYAVLTKSGPAAGESVADYRNRTVGQYNKTMAAFGQTTSCYAADGQTSQDCGSSDAKYICSGSNKPLTNSSECGIIPENNYDYYSIAYQQVGAQALQDGAGNVVVPQDINRRPMNSSTMTISDAQIKDLELK